MKKLLALLLSVLMLLTLTACEEEEVDMALDIAFAVMEELEKYEDSQSDALPEFTGEGAGSIEEIPEFSACGFQKGFSNRSDAAPSADPNR